MQRRKKGLCRRLAFETGGLSLLSQRYAEAEGVHCAIYLHGYVIFKLAIQAMESSSLRHGANRVYEQ